MKERLIIWFYNHFDQMLSVNVNNIDNKFTKRSTDCSINNKIY